jgi:hypothetical protein
VARWYLPDVAQRTSELDSFDVIEDLMIQGGIRCLHGRLASWRFGGMLARSKHPATKVVSAMSDHWRNSGLPAYAQFDNDAGFQGNHRSADSSGGNPALIELGSYPSLYSASGNPVSSRH